MLVLYDVVCSIMIFAFVCSVFTIKLNKLYNNFYTSIIINSNPIAFTVHI